MAKKNVNVGDFLGYLDGDLWVKSEENFHKGDNEYTAIHWYHDGIECYDIWHTNQGCINVYYEGEGEPSEDDIFMAVYTTTEASLRLPNHEIEDISSSMQELVKGRLY